MQDSEIRKARISGSGLSLFIVRSSECPLKVKHNCTAGIITESGEKQETKSCQFYAPSSLKPENSNTVFINCRKHTQP